MAETRLGLLYRLYQAVSFQRRLNVLRSSADLELYDSEFQTVRWTLSLTFEVQ